MLQNYTKNRREQNLFSTYNFRRYIFSVQTTFETASEQAKHVGKQSEERVLARCRSKQDESTRNGHHLK